MIIIRLKSGFELPITCKKFRFSTSSITGEITNYSIEGIEDNKPLFFRAEDIECIWQKMDTLKTSYEWIPVCERMPEEGTEVLGVDDHGCIRHVVKDKCNPYEFATYEEMMHINIVAWMPLPDPWKGGE